MVFGCVEVAACGEIFTKRERGRRGRGLGAGCSLSFFSLVSLLIIFNTEVGGLGALRWLLGGKYLQREKEGGEGEA